MPTPAKPYIALVSEKKSHRTKEELNLRKQGEEALSTGVAMKERHEVKNNPIAHKEFLRLNKLLKEISKNDAINEAVINRYCLIYAECHDFEEKRESFYKDLQELTSNKGELIDSEEISLSTYYKMKHNMQTTIINLDKQVQSKRKMLLDIEKENIMTIAAALRCIPKKVEDEKDDPLLIALRGG
ncbi:P27 family phage terminase small subunit [Lachnoclostridium sp.]|uniref:P27 family phage terminase small subunit n=1 Tax=Lachnoclostridium sp. TaxID=2028282 RepID=UPI0028A0CDC1|nr:P27 family phage terminase small subunit [Lachnoclostridium sp.]